VSLYSSRRPGRLERDEAHVVPADGVDEQVRSETVYLGPSRERAPHSTFALLNQDSAVGATVSVAAGTDPS